jgi:hypothetical protein
VKEVNDLSQMRKACVWFVKARFYASVFSKTNKSATTRGRLTWAWVMSALMLTESSSSFICCLLVPAIKVMKKNFTARKSVTADPNV